MSALSAIGLTVNPFSVPYSQRATSTASVTSVTGAGQDPDGDGDVDAVGRTDRDSARISGPGQLLSLLQQLQSQDPARFKQVVSEIATQLQTAASQNSQNPAGQFLTDLATRFQKVADTGDLSQLSPPAPGNRVQQTYSNDGRNLVADLAASRPARHAHPAGQGTGPGAKLEQLFASLVSEVQQAVAA